MANLLEICELCWLQLNPHGDDESAITKEEVIATGRTLYATQMWVQAKNEKNQEGYYNVPSVLLTSVELPVISNEIDLSGLKILRGLPSEMWLVDIGGLACKCDYIKSTHNTSKLLCDDETFDSFRTYLVEGSKIKFPKGAHAETIPIVYANSGENVDGRMEIEDTVAGILRDKIIETYIQKTGKEDTTNNSNPNI